MRILICVLCLFSGCAMPKSPQLEIYSPLLSADDLRQIKTLVAGRPDIRRPVWEIATEGARRDRARVSAGPWGKAGDVSDYFYVEKRAGKWRIIPPVRHDRLKAENIVTIS
jgi:hypothetical protein